jgi:acetyltransferase
VRLRFFGPMRELSHTLTDRLSHLDDRREMALIAQHNGAALGAASYFIEPDARNAEFAITVRSDWHGRGIGYLLLTRLIEVARHAGLDELSGVVLRENKPMLDMCRDLGFTIAREPNDATVLRVRRALAAID